MPIYAKFNTDKNIINTVNILKSILENYSDKEKQHFVFSLRSMDKICALMKNENGDQKINYAKFSETFDNYFFNGFIGKTEQLIVMYSNLLL